MKKPDPDYLMVPRDSHLNIRVPSVWKAAAKRAWERARKLPGGERFQTFTDFVIWKLVEK